MTSWTNQLKHYGGIIRHGTTNRLARSSLILLFLLAMILPTTMVAGTISGTFTTLANCPMNLTCFTVDPTTGYFFGQGDQSSTNYYRYNPSTNTWSTLASCPQSSGNNGGATYLNGKIYNSYCSQTTMTVYDIASNTLSTIIGGMMSGNITNDGTNLYISGSNSSYTASILKKYVVSTGTWVTLATSSRYGDNSWGGLQYKNGYIYHHPGDGQEFFDRYNIATNTWEDLTNVPGGAVLGSAIYDAYYYCQGSYGGTNLYSYDLGQGAWNNTLTLPFTTNDAAIVTYGNSLYIVQGEAGKGFTKFTPNNPLLMNIEGTALSYTIGSAAANITATLTASQNAGTNFASATVSITSGFQTGKDVLSYTNANGINGSWNATTGVLTLSGTTSIANYQTALRSVNYNNIDPTSSSTARVVSFQVSDGSISSNTASRTINLVIPANTAPVLYNEGAPKLTDQVQNNLTPAGTLVSAIIASSTANGGNMITDANAGNPEGIAIIAAETLNGGWQFTTNGGTNWQDLGPVSATSARLLGVDANTKLRFVPAAGFIGTANITIRAWDQFTGTNGAALVDVSTNGGTTAFSSAIETVSVTLTPANNPTVLTLTTTTRDFYENDLAFSIDPNMTVTDVENDNLDGAVVTILNNFNAAEDR